MRRRLFLLFAGIFAVSLSFSQIKRQFSIENYANIEHVDLFFRVNSGSCFIKPSLNDELLNVYSNQNYNDYSHSFDKSLANDICKIRLDLHNEKSAGLGQSISYRMFGKNNETAETLWKVYLTRNKTYDLNLNYGLGHADIDLSGLSVKNLKIHTGSADISIGYLPEQYNPVVMDTFYVKVDLGSVNVENLNLARAKHVVADIGFGNLLLDFSDKPKVACHVKGSVGAGNLLIVLPDEQIPVIVTINESWLCKIKLSDSFTSLTKNTFVNNAYRQGARDPLHFNLDVSMGSIVFKEKK